VTPRDLVVPHITEPSWSLAVAPRRACPRRRAHRHRGAQRRRSCTNLV